MKRRLMVLLPLALFCGLAIFMAANLGQPQQKIIQSHMIGKPLPSFQLEVLEGHTGLQLADFQTGQPVLVNIFASWCLPCAIEAPKLAELQKRGAPIYGVAVRDAPSDVSRFLEKHGNPFTRVGLDSAGRLMLGLGSSGVPETYVVDGKGIIRFQHLGEIREEHVPVLLAELEKAR